jgi:hypothetical protein
VRFWTDERVTVLRLAIASRYKDRGCSVAGYMCGIRWKCKSLYALVDGGSTSLVIQV